MPNNVVRIRNGFDIKLVRKSDILQCIDDNIIDKEIALRIITELEQDAYDNLAADKWVGIPYIGNIKKKPGVAINKKYATTIAGAKENLDHESYVLFRKQLSKDYFENEKFISYSAYAASRNAIKYRKYYKRLCKTKNEHIVNTIMYALSTLKDINSDDD